MTSRQIFTTLFSSVVLLVLISACRPSSEPIPTETAEPTILAPTGTAEVIPPTDADLTETPTEAPGFDSDQIISELEENLSGRLKTIEFEHENDPEWIYVRWDLEGGGTNQMIAEQTKEETTEILDTIYHSGANFNRVTLSGWYTITIDINNTLEYIEMLSVLYDKEILDQINWQTVRPEYIWLIAERSMVHRLLKEE